MRAKIAHEEALFYEELLKKEINSDREAHEKKPLKDSDKDNNKPSSGGGMKDFTTDVPKDKKLLNAAQPFQKADGSEKENINMYSHIQLKPRVISLAGLLATQLILETCMTAEPLNHFMTK